MKYSVASIRLHCSTQCRPTMHILLIFINSDCLKLNLIKSQRMRKIVCKQRDTTKCREKKCTKMRVCIQLTSLAQANWMKTEIISNMQRNKNNKITCPTYFVRKIFLLCSSLVSFDSHLSRCLLFLHLFHFGIHRHQFFCFHFVNAHLTVSIFITFRLKFSEIPLQAVKMTPCKSMSKSMRVRMTDDTMNV